MEKPGSFWRSRRSCPSLPMPLCDLCGLCVCVVICCFAAEGWGSQRVGESLPEQEMRRAHVRTQEEGLGFQPPASRAAWGRRTRELQRQILVAAGLWPMLPKSPLRPRVYGRLERDGYTVEKVVL